MTVVLVAEDDVDIRNLIAMALRFRHVDVIEAFDGKDALEKTIQLQPDILLLDINMPYLNGFEVCEQIRLNAKVAHTPVIFVSAKIEQDELTRARTFGVDVVIEKPFDFSYLVSKIHSLIYENSTGRCV